jgi:O-antigen ligase
VDSAGAALVLAAVGWTYVAAAANAGARPGPVALLLASVAGAYVAGRASGRWFPVAGPALLATVVVAILLTSPGAFSGQPGAPPFGYPNANAALLVQVVAAVVLAALATRVAWGRWLLLAAAVALAAVAPLLRSAAGTVLAVAVVVMGAAVTRLRRPGRVIVVAAAGAALAVAATVVLAAAASDAAPHTGLKEASQAADGALGTRVELWREALSLTRESPVTGVGPGRFADKSPTASGDPDLRWAHTAVLEQAADQGIPGALLLAALAGWAFVALAASASSRPTPVAAAGAVGFAALAVHASVDYVLHFPAVPLSAAALLGVASARAGR